MAHEISVEEWRPIPGYEGIYEASNLGRVRGLDRIDAAGRRWKGRIRVQSTDAQGRKRVNLSRDGSKKLTQVHRLVMLAFVGAPPEGHEVCHNDGDPANNRLDNLRWDTKRANNLDAVHHGTNHQTAKTACPLGHTLEEPNLRRSSLANGRRACLACHRGRATARNRGTPFTPEIAHEHYAKLR